MGKKKKNSRRVSVDDIDQGFMQVLAEASTRRNGSSSSHQVSPNSLLLQPNPTEKVSVEEKGESQSISEAIKQGEISASETLLKKEENIPPSQDASEGKIKEGKCQHLKDAAKSSMIKRKMAQQKDWNHCEGCLDAEAKAKKKVQRIDVTMTGLPISETESTVEALPAESLWMCLSCCKINCGRMVNKHALSHHEEMKGNHPLSINLGTMECWCYNCDSQITASKNRNQLVKEYQATIENFFQLRQHKMRVSSKKSKGSIDTKASAKYDVVVSPNMPKAKVFTAGLQNLGNTCFFNSVMQVLAETNSLKKILSDKDIDTNHFPNSLAAKTDTGLGPLTTNFKALLHTMWKQQGGTITPKELFTQIGKKWKVFRGFRQQDSQELMRYLFDGIKQEELDMIKRQLSEETGTSGGTDESESNKLDPKTAESADNSVDSKKPTADEIGGASKYIPFIDTCFSGKLVSVIVCDTCKKCSYASEDFFDLSLPVRRPAKVGELNPKARLLSQPKKEERITSDASVDENDSLPIPEKPTKAHMYHVGKVLRNIGNSDSEDLTILRSLNQFTSVECLDGDNKFACENCYKLIHGSDKKLDGELSAASTENNNTGELEGDESTPNGKHNVTDDARAGHTDTKNEIDIESDEDDQCQNQENKKDKEVSEDKDRDGSDDSDGSNDDNDDDDDNNDDDDKNDDDGDEEEKTDRLGNIIPRDKIGPKNGAEAETSTKKAAHIFRKGYKRYLISEVPPTLVLHLKRFEQSGRFGLMRKIEDHVDIPAELDMSPYFVPKNEIEDEDEGDNDGNGSSNGPKLPEQHQQDDNTSKKYRLYGAVVHMGTLSGGHYINYVLSSKVGALASKATGSTKPDKKGKSTKSQQNVDSDVQEQLDERKECTAEQSTCKDENNDQCLPKSEKDRDSIEMVDEKADTRQWISCSDSHVRPSSLEEVLASRAYLLFYERC
ncbi:Ubiquitin carboxyl-terminal hydrolase 16 [Entomortierella beljakovae]|nr:Ubiquitin carboxyl-terminal hydrolase 16 [Entomortierella beljakovae]